MLKSDLENRKRSEKPMHLLHSANFGAVGRDALDVEALNRTLRIQDAGEHAAGLAETTLRSTPGGAQRSEVTQIATIVASRARKRHHLATAEASRWEGDLVITGEPTASELVQELVGGRQGHAAASIEPE